MFRVKRRKQKEAELDITAFLNLMIVLVPVLLLGLVFSQITVLDVKLPDVAGDSSIKPDLKHVELVLTSQGMVVNFPKGIQLKSIPVSEQGEHDFKTLSLVLQQVKRELKEQNIERRSITILSEPETSYQTIVSAMDTVRSFKAVVVASVVDAALFPEISFGDAPENTAKNAFKGGRS